MDFKNKIIKYIKINTFLGLFSNFLGIISNIVFIRLAGLEIYGNIIYFNGFKNSVNFFIGLGLSNSFTRFWVEFDDTKKKYDFFNFYLFIKIFILAIFISVFLLKKEIIFLHETNIFHNINIIWVFMLIMAVFLRSIVTPVILAELDNLRFFLCNIFQSLIFSGSLILFTVIKFEISNLIRFLIFSELFFSLILVFYSRLYFEGFNLSFNFNFFTKEFFRRFIRHYINTLILTLYRYFTELSFLGIILERRGLLKELGFISIIMKFITFISNIIGIPINKVLTIVFVKAYKLKDFILLNRTFNYITKYFSLFYSFVFILLFHSSDWLIYKMYNISMGVNFLNIYFVVFLLYTIFSVSSSINNIFENYKESNLFAILSLISLLLFLYYIKELTIKNLVFYYLIPFSIFSSLNTIYCLFKYRKVRFPIVFFIKIASISFISIIIGYISTGIFFRSTLTGISYIILFIIFYKLQKDDISIIRDFLPQYEKKIRYIFREK